MNTPATKLKEMQKALLSAQQVLKPLGINVSEYIILAAVGEDRGNDPPRTAQEIARALIMHPPRTCSSPASSNKVWSSEPRCCATPKATASSTGRWCS